jgi:hypothetical protein
MTENELHHTDASASSGLWVVIGLCFIALTVYLIARILQQKAQDPDATAEKDDFTINKITEHLRSFYAQKRNRYIKSYNIMHSLSLETDDKISEAPIVIDVKDLGIKYLAAKHVGYPYIAKLINSVDSNEWNKNFSMVHSIAEKCAEIDVINIVLQDNSTKLKSQDLENLKHKVEKLEKECLPYPGIRSIIRS